MIPNPFNLLQTIGIGALAVGLVVGVEELRLHDVRKDLKVQQAALAIMAENYVTAKNNVATCKDSITRRNHLIEEEAARGKLEAIAASEKANKGLKAAKERAARAAAQGSGPEVMNEWLNEVVK